MNLKRKCSGSACHRKKTMSPPACHDHLKVEETPIRMVVMGEAYLQREKSDKPNRFVCLISDQGKVVLTFFTEQ
ncbi:hypothetical protein IC232_25000 [Microvirga sp. BT688]|nr:hypothetical protein [Microvirga sp.]